MSLDNVLKLPAREIDYWIAKSNKDPLTPTLLKAIHLQLCVLTYWVARGPAEKPDIQTFLPSYYEMPVAKPATPEAIHAMQAKFRAYKPK